MSKKAEQIKSRYINGYVTDEQLKRYYDLGVITEAEYAEIYATRHPEADGDEKPTTL